MNPKRCVVCHAPLDPTERGRLVSGDDIGCGYACHDVDACNRRVVIPQQTPPSARHLAAIYRGHATALRSIADEHDHVASLLEECVTPLGRVG